MNISHRSKLSVLLTDFGILLSRAIFFVLVYVLSASSQELYINEVMASNSTTIADEDGDFEDWIELFHSGAEPLNLNGIGLSDDYDRPFRWVFPDTVLHPGEFMLIWASGKNREQPGEELHASFSISAGGEEVLLTAQNGGLIDELAPIAIPTDISFGRRPDAAGEWFFFSEPTPGEPNLTQGYQNLLQEPEFSHEAGFYTDGFDLVLDHPDPDVIIYYTLDGSRPTDSSMVYTGRIEIEDRTGQTSTTPTMPDNRDIRKATVIRAAAKKQGYLSSSVKTKTYFVFPEHQPYTLPVISLSTAPENLFDEETGIYHSNNANERGRDWEREASFELFEKGGEPGLSQDIGIRIHGGWSRRFDQKSFRLYARNEYGDSRFYYQVFPSAPDEEYNRLILRNSGNDWRQTMFRDAAAQSLIRHINVDTQAYRPTVLYLNGEYWGIQNLRERYDKHYLQRVYDVDPENIDLLTGRNTVKEGDNSHYNTMIEFLVQENLSDDKAYRKAGEMMDIDNFLDYYTAQIYYANNDWPHNNIDFWRKRVDYQPGARPGHDGRWRWLLYDVDRSLGYHTNYTYNALEWVTSERNVRFDAEWPNIILRSLLENSEFENAFINRMADHLNTAFKPERVHQVIDSLAAFIEPEMEEYINRWSQPISMEAWLNYVEIMHQNAKNRPGFVQEHYSDHFNINGLIQLTADVSDDSHGYVQVNSISLIPSTPGIPDNPYPWTGTYFQDIPITLKAISRPGYSFSYWEIDGEEFTSAEIEIVADGPVSVEAVFEPADYFPVPYTLSDGDYLFEEWPEDAPAQTYPPHMRFVYMDENDPGLSAEKSGFTEGEYNLTSRTRINGLEEYGFAFINTGNEEGNEGYPGRRLGGAVLALDTRGKENIHVRFQAGTVRPNSRVYSLRLQYRIGNDGPFHNVTDPEGNAIEYLRNDKAGHSRLIGPVILPPAAHGEPMIQLLWRYYYTGDRLDNDSGQRSKLNISKIRVDEMEPVGIHDGDKDHPGEFALNQNYPNPFNPATNISYELPVDEHVRLDVYDVVGRRVATLVNQNQNSGRHQVTFDASGLASGMYIYRLQTESFTATQKMILLK